jgi:hypothetical protein
MAMYDSIHTGVEIDNAVKVVIESDRLMDFSLADLHSAVTDNSLAKYGLKPGDQKTINGRTYIIAGLNPMKGVETPNRVTINHVGLIVYPHLSLQWNASGKTSEGANGRGAGYLNSDLHYYLVNTLLPLVETDLGSANLISHSKIFTNAVNVNGINRFGVATGVSSGWTWVPNCKICALSEVQVYGSVVWSSSGYDTGEACRQLEVFQKYSHTEIFGGDYPWLRDIVSATEASRADGRGSANFGLASYNISVAAFILFK